MPPTGTPVGGANLTHKLGRVIPNAAQRRRAVPLRNFLKVANGRPIPESDDYKSKAQPALTQMMNNNREGCCVATTLMKRIGMIHSNRPGGAPIVATDAETSRLYHEIGGPGDNGLVMVDAYEYMMRTGAQVGRQRYKIDGYASVDVRDRATLDAAFHWFGGLDLGVNLLESQYANFRTGTLWDCKPGRVVGGHAIPLTTRNAVQFDLATWAEQPSVLRSCVEGGRWADECYCVISRDMFDASGADANHVHWDQLSAAMDAIKSGQTPVIPADPNPPTPTPPDEWVWNLERNWHLLGYTLHAHLGLRHDEAMMRAGAVDWWALASALYDCYSAFRAKDWAALAAAAMRVLILLGIDAPTERAREIGAGIGRALEGLHAEQPSGTVPVSGGG